MAESRLPSGYTPYKELSLCSNILQNVPIPLRVGNQPGVLVGVSPLVMLQVPSIWLSAQEPVTKEWVFVVEKSRPLRPLIVGQVDQRERTIEIRVGDTVVIRAKHIGPERAVVDALDMRPFGLAVYGNDRGLQIGGMMMERNTLANMETAFAIGAGEDAVGMGP